jgi:hypothetical protein
MTADKNRDALADRAVGQTEASTLREGAEFTPNHTQTTKT